MWHPIEEDEVGWEWSGRLGKVEFLNVGFQPKLVFVSKTKIKISYLHFFNLSYYFNNWNRGSSATKAVMGRPQKPTGFVDDKVAFVCFFVVVVIVLNYISARWPDVAWQLGRVVRSGTCSTIMEKKWSVLRRVATGSVKI